MSRISDQRSAKVGFGSEHMLDSTVAGVLLKPVRQSAKPKRPAHSRNAFGPDWATNLNGYALLPAIFRSKSTRRRGACAPQCGDGTDKSPFRRNMLIVNRPDDGARGCGNHTASSATDTNGGLDAERLVRSAAHAAECTAAVYYLSERSGAFKTQAFFGIEAHVDPIAAGWLLDTVAQHREDDILVINDVLVSPQAGSGDARLFGAHNDAIRFVAAARVVDGRGILRGVLVVANASPLAGLSAAKTYVLQSHAAQLSALSEMNDLRAASAVSPSDAERLRLLESVVVNSNDAVIITRAEPINLPGPQIVYCNAAFTRTTGYSEAEVLGRTPRLLQSELTDRATLDRLKKALQQWKPVEVELLNRRKDGTDFWVELSIVPVANEKGWFTHWVSVQRDVSGRKKSEETATRARIAEAENLVLEAEIQERQRVEEKLLYTAFHDHLTNLRNRAFFMDRLKIAMEVTKDDPNCGCAVLFLDLNRFKLVNDSLGHRAGDLLLMEVAQCLGRCTGPKDTLARMGGDEFAILVEGAEMPAVIALADRITQAMREPLWIGSQEIFTSCSIGIVKATETHRSSEDLLRDADVAMYQAKRHEANGYALFAASMHDGAVESLALQTDLQNAVARGEFILQYQPICQAENDAIVGVEALIRWQHPTKGLVLPDAFIAAAEQTGLIREIGRWVLRESCRQMRTWRDRFPAIRLLLSINTSGEELKDLNFTFHLLDTVAAFGLDPRTVQIEITETVFHQDPDFIGNVLANIREGGIRIALDDFGTGYSSLSYLDRFQIDTIKIDRSFVARMLERERTLSIVASIVGLGRSLDLDIVAEGVENDAQLRILQAAGCRYVQGYYLGVPMSAADLAAALTRQLVAKQIGTAA